MIRSILSVIAGLVVLTIVSFAIEAAVDPLLMHMFPRALPDAAALAASVPARWFMIAYSMFSIAAGGYFTAWIARRAPVIHAAIMGAIEVAFTLYVMIAAPFPEAHQAPAWSWIATIILIVPAACFGAAVRPRHPAPSAAVVAPRTSP
jgi:hypothetical protein